MSEKAKLFALSPPIIKEHAPPPPLALFVLFIFLVLIKEKIIKRRT
jgi:hypothetical protein